MGKYDFRINYVKLLQRLLVESGQQKIDTTKLSDYNLLLQINLYLKMNGYIVTSLTDNA